MSADDQATSANQVPTPPVPDPSNSTPPLPSSDRGFYYTKRKRKYEGPPQPRRKLSKRTLIGTIIVGVIFVFILGNNIASSIAREFDKRIANQAPAWIIFYANQHDGVFPTSMDELATAFPQWAAVFRRQNPLERPDLMVFKQRLVFDFSKLPRSMKELDPGKPEPFFDVIRLQTDPGKPMHAPSHTLWLLMKNTHPSAIASSQPAPAQPSTQP